MTSVGYALTAPLARGPYAGLAPWLEVLATCPFARHAERALWSGLHADRLGYAFVGGYGAALGRLGEHGARAEGGEHGRPLAARLSLCATEAGGARPRAIATRLDDQAGTLLLNGEKTFATLATIAEELLVVASRGVDAEGRNRLRLVRVRRDARGVSIVARDPLPFAPEIPHATVRFVDVVVEAAEVLPGDGYDVYLKPFRTIEDTHLLLAAVGYVLGAARAYAFDPQVVAELASVALALGEIGERPPGAALTHVVLAGVFGTARRLFASLDHEWKKAPDDERERWARDQPLLMVADGVREQRTATAWKTLAPA
jgi:hypothetical protein